MPWPGAGGQAGGQPVGGQRAEDPCLPLHPPLPSCWEPAALPPGHEEDAQADGQAVNLGGAEGWGEGGGLGGLWEAGGGEGADGGEEGDRKCSPGEVVSVLATAGPPGETLSVILGLVYNMEESLGLAKKVGVASVVVDVLLAYQKDELAIMSYQATMTANSRDWFSALRNSNSKWRNEAVIF